MPVLRLRSISQAGRGPEARFSGPRVRIGRSRDNDLILPDKENPASSSHHADALLDSSGAWWIVDASTGGTLLNGVRAARQTLKSGDRLTFGDEQFSVTIGGGSARWLIGAALVALILVGLPTLVVLERGRGSAPLEQVATSAARSVFLIALQADGKRTVVGTGFAVDTGGWLATNAHIAAFVTSGIAEGRAVAVQGDTYAARRIVRALIHPDWRADSIQKDVALLELEPGPALTPLVIGGPAALSQIQRGAPVATFGFPAVSTDAERPRGRLAADVVGDVRGEYLEVGLGIAPGTSGSPVFDESGQVVAIVAGGDFVGRPGEAARPSGTQANWALSASVIREVLALK